MCSNQCRSLLLDLAQISNPQDLDPLIDEFDMPSVVISIGPKHVDKSSSLQYGLNGVVLESLHQSPFSRT